MARTGARTFGCAAPFFCVWLASAQYGTAPSGYYPANYNGSTFTGVVIDSTGDQIMMTQTRKGKVETFTGRLETSCSIPEPNGSLRKMTATDFPRSVQLTVFFSTVSKSAGGQKVKENQIIGLAFNQVQGGNPIPLEPQTRTASKVPIFSCSQSGFKIFKPF